MASEGAMKTVFINKIHLNCSQVDGGWIEHIKIPNIDYIKPFSLEMHSSIWLERDKELSQIMELR